MGDLGYWLATAFSALLGTVGIRMEETPDYRTLRSEGRFEIRAYGPLLVAETRDPGSPREAADVSFRRLAAYIFGANTAGAKIAMTAPVTMARAGEKIAMTAPVTMEPAGTESVMRFVVPSKFTRETVPQPTDAGVVLRELPAETVAVVRYSGRSTPQAVEECERALREWLSAKRIGAEGPARIANYDSPFALPFLRRNEVMIPVQADAAGH